MFSTYIHHQFISHSIGKSIDGIFQCTERNKKMKQIKRYNIFMQIPAKENFLYCKEKYCLTFYEHSLNMFND